MQAISINQPETFESLVQLSTAEEAAITGGARLSFSESIGAAVPGASGFASIRGSSSGSSVTTQYSIGTNVQTRSGSSGQRSFFSGQLFDFF